MDTETADDEIQWPAPFDYYTPHPETEIRQRLDTITPWVEWIRTMTALDGTTIPDCWASHGALLLELDAAYTAYLTFMFPANSGGQPLSWHYSWAQCKARLQAYAARTKCDQLGHREDPIKPWTRQTPIENAT
ncbi:hypothetical protein ACFRJ9_21440 [Paenarthrobacter sp. NPDC056912]|uniref:hypothetical protein n=1 Tax=Paenarthrobacter sp. NPDC056912 TaxID=3345965 RepID=UPI00366BEB83